LPSQQALAPSESGEALPAVTVPPLPAEHGRESGEGLGGAVGADALVAGEGLAASRRGGGDDEVVVTALLPRLAGEPVGVCGELVLAFAADAVPLPELLGGLAEGDGPGRRHRRVDEPPPQCRVGGLEAARRVGAFGLREHPGGAAHRLDPADEHEIGLVAVDLA